MFDRPKQSSNDLFRNWLAFFLISSFVGMLPMLIFKTIPKDNKELIVYIIGQLSGMATTALGAYFVNKAGQDTLDAKRADNTGRMADAVIAAANSMPVTDTPQPVTVVNDTENPVPVEGQTNEGEKS